VKSLKNSIPENLVNIGVEKGDCIVLHCSCKAIGRDKNYSPSDFIADLLGCIGTEGTLVMPTFTYSYSGIWNAKPFNKDKTPGVLNGVISETFRQMPGVFRSGHPTYSVAAKGKFAKEITEKKENSSPLGKGSSYDAAYKLGAKILLVGVGNNRNSMLHYCEAISSAPYNDIPFRAFWGRSALVENEGKVIEHNLVDEFPACSENFGAADEFLLKNGILKKGFVGNAESMIIKSGEMVPAILKKLDEQPDWLLCDNFTCEPCSLRKKRLREKGLI